MNGNPTELIDILKNHVTPERWQRILKVSAKRTRHMSVMTEGLYDKGNVSAVMRSAEAFGFDQFHVVELTEKFKESKRVTQGAHKWLEITKWSSTSDCVQKLRQEGRKIYVTHLDETATPIHKLDLSEPFALCFGNEKKGASAELLAEADERVYIPMSGFVESFNISVAAAIAFYHMSLQLGSKLINEDEQHQVQLNYLKKSIAHWQELLP